MGNIETATLKPRTAAATAGRPNRILVALAAAWMILSLAVGGMLAADPSTGEAPTRRAAAERAAQP